MIEIILKGLPKTPNQLNSMHWAVKAKETKRWQAQTIWVAKKYKPKHPYPKVQITFIRGSSKQCDFDNGIASVKPIIDGLVKAGIIADDNPSIVTAVFFGWEKAKPKEGYLKIIIDPYDKSVLF